LSFALKFFFSCIRYKPPVEGHYFYGSRAFLFLFPRRWWNHSHKKKHDRTSPRHS